MLWELAPLIAGRPVLRLQDRDSHYRPASEQPLTAVPPQRPAAAMILTTSGMVRTLCLDLDSKAGMSQLRRSRTTVLSLLTRCALEWVEDFSPSGGVHLYVPLQTEISADRARALAENLSRLAPSLDPSPHRNGKHGCIRLPGSAHRLGGRQLLTTALPAAKQILLRRNPAAALRRLESALSEQLPSPCPATASASTTPTPGHPAPQRRGLSSLGQAVALHGDIPADYRSPSEARMAALCSLSACGWNAEQVWAGLRGTDLPGLSSLYSKYGSEHTIRERFSAEWSKAQTYLARPAKNPSEQPPQRPLPKNDINAPISQGGQHLGAGNIRRIKLALGILDARLSGAGRSSLGLRMMLRSLLTFATMTGSVEVAVGCRSHAVATGVHHGTAAKLLKELATLKDSCIRLVAKGRGLEADRYVIDLDPGLRSHVATRSGPRALVHALRPAFRVLGAAAALVYEALEEGCVGSVKEISHAAGLGTSTVYRELQALSSFGLVERTPYGWRLVRSRSLLRVAVELGMIEVVGAQLLRYQRERARWKDIVLGPGVSGRFLQEWELYDAEIEQDRVLGDLPPDPGRPRSESPDGHLELV